MHTNLSEKVVVMQMGYVYIVFGLFILATHMKIALMHSCTYVHKMDD